MYCLHIESTMFLHQEYWLFCRALLQKRPMSYDVSRCIAYEVALVSRIDKIISLFCKRALQKSQYSAKETYTFIDPTIRSHPIHVKS